MNSNAASARSRGLRPGSAGVPPGSALVSPGNAGVPPAKGGHRQDESTAVSAVVPPTPIGWHSRGYLPHFDRADRVQALTFRLGDSVPAHVIAAWRSELNWREGLPVENPASAVLRKRLATYEDAGHGACHLRNPRVSALMDGALRFFNGERYRLLAWTIMPNHVHVLVETITGYLIGEIVHSWKSFIAHRANALLRESGGFWSADYHDRYIRDENHLWDAVVYIEMNPVKAGLCERVEDWPGSRAGVAWQMPTPVAFARGGRDARVPGADQNRSGRDARAPGAKPPARFTS